MFSLDYYQVMANYNQWMNQKLYGFCAELPDSERRRDCGAFFQSIHGTLNHLMYGDLAWMGRFRQREFPRFLGLELYAEFGDLHRARVELDQEILQWAATLDLEWLQAPFSYTSAVDRKVRTLPAWMLVVHMFNHQIHHRGQLTTLLSQLGIDYGPTDLPWLPTLEAVQE